MAEDAFERFRRLQGVAQPVSVQEQAQQTEGEAPLSPLALLLDPSGSPQRMTAMALFRDLRQCGAVLLPMVDHVRIAAPPGQPCPAVLRELLDLLEEFGEWAAIQEYEAGLPRADAEALAWSWLEIQYAQEVLTLHAAQPT